MILILKVKHEYLIIHCDIIVISDRDKVEVNTEISSMAHTYPKYGCSAKNVSFYFFISRYLEIQGHLVGLKFIFKYRPLSDHIINESFKFQQDRTVSLKL